MKVYHDLGETDDDFTIHTRLPGVEEEVEIALDYWGEQNLRLQALCYEANEDEMRVAVRYGADGKIAEVWVHPDIKVHQHGEMTPWLLERDGA